MRLLRARHIALLTVALAACSSENDRTIDTAATYDVYGERFEPATAVPAPAVVAEAEEFVGRQIMVEGMAVDTCKADGCWTSINAGAGMRIDVFLADDTLSVPDNVSERRIVVTGTFEQTMTEAADSLGSAFALHATGIMVEKVRS